MTSPRRSGRRTSWCRGRSAKSSGRCGRGYGIASLAPRIASTPSPRKRGEVRNLTLALQDLEHTARHRDAAFVDGYFRRDENKAAGGTHRVRPRDQNLADLAGLNEVRIKLHGGQRRLARNVTGGHAAGAVGEGHEHAALHQAAAIVMLVLGG